ncbi:hypothetical protein L227DRAFT_573232 [Lentinus tigrinus ALCF2SS1-6]|uniref:Uncharacterized protein n=1 Tax=Lentinus tigrinus ALCF2SS1-6 TaxID=1328759 RepID=A0A5C2SG13_9APHY|nr:hypothetical protein L227DRAFT_573232 [Lentinus tigrinus ALCF2SS1-6]
MPDAAFALPSTPSLRSSRPSSRFAVRCGVSLPLIFPSSPGARSDDSAAQPPPLSLSSPTLAATAQTTVYGGPPRFQRGRSPPARVCTHPSSDPPPATLQVCSTAQHVCRVSTVMAWHATS